MDDAWNEQERGPKQALNHRPQKTIWKYQIPVLEDFEIALPSGAEIIRFANEGGKLWLWAAVEPDNEPEPIRLLAIKAGGEMPDFTVEYLGCAAIYIQQELMLYYFKVCGVYDGTP